jgi:uncharacterized protein
MRNSVLWDSSAIFALIDKTDRNHDIAVRTMRGVLRKTTPFITSAVEMETHALLLARIGRGVARPWLGQHGLPLVRPTEAEEAAGRELVIQHGDKDWSFCDCVSFAVIEGRRARGAFTFDRNFRERNRFEVFGLPK